MNNTTHHDERIAKMTFASVYPHYVTKVEKKIRPVCRRLKLMFPCNSYMQIPTVSFPAKV